LPKKGLGIEIENNFQPKYVVIPKAKKTLNFLKNQVKKSQEVILATDFDREGEAIAWHLAQALNLKNQEIKRITFNEITPSALKEALKNPRGIDEALVMSQQARRVLDRLVGYNLSPFLWKKVAFGLSAGRVQSVAVRLVVMREKEIENFQKEEFWKIIAILEKEQKEFSAYLIKKDGKTLDKLSIKTEADARKILDELKNSDYLVEAVTKEEVKRFPPPPFITSTLQQEAFYRLGFSAKKTMFLAQQLYESGLISYHRTDSTHLSTEAVNATRKYLKEQFGEKYLPEKPFIYRTKVLRAQEAHEAIRPTNIAISSVQNQHLSEDHQKLYDLIWRRTLACQMREAQVESEKVEISAGRYGFLATGQRVIFEGFTRVYPLELKENLLPPLQAKDKLNLRKLEKKQNFTQPPARYTEASLIKTLEKEGIGRPSTYAPILSTIQSRGYIKKARQYLFPTEMGRLVNDLLEKYFGDIVDLKFTAKMEHKLDKIAEGSETYQQLIRDFYHPFSQNLQEKDKILDKNQITTQTTEEKCEKCGAPLVIKIGRYGKFLACSRYPECKNTKPYLETTGKKCPECKKGEVIKRKNKKGQVFYGCSRYPQCRWVADKEPADQ